ICSMKRAVTRRKASKSSPACFHADASAVLSSLRTSVADVLCALPAVRKPADLRKCLHLDWTLAWQLFQVADLGNEPVPLLAAGPVVPSRTSLKKFLDRAAANGAAPVG